LIILVKNFSPHLEELLYKGENLGIFWSVNLTHFTKILEKITKFFMSENWGKKLPPCMSF
jgi:SPX domain protein involved in polyphosphate accumulation